MQRKPAFFCVAAFFISVTLAAQTSFKDSVNFYFKKGDLNKAIFFGELALKECRDFPEKNDTNLVVSTNDLAFAYLLAGKLDFAQPLFEESLLRAEKVFGINHHQYASILGNYGKLKKDQGKYTEAESLMKKAISITINKSGRDFEKYLILVNDLGLVYLETGNFYAAETSFLQLLQDRKKANLDQDNDYTTALNNLAFAYYNMGNYAAADVYFQQAVNLFIKTLTFEHAKTATAISNLGFVKMFLEDYQMADSLFKKSLFIKEKIFTKNNDQYAVGLNSLGKLYTKMEKYPEAEKLFLEALEIRKRLLTEFHPNYAITIRDLGLFYFSINENEKAEAYFKEALSITKKNIGVQNTVYINLSNNLATLFLALKNYQKADLSFMETNATEKILLVNALDFLSEKELLLYLKSREASFALPYSSLWHYHSPQLIKAEYNNCLLLKGVSIQNTNILSNQMERSKDSLMATLWKDYKSNRSLLNKTLALPIIRRNINTDSLSNITNQQEKDLLRRSATYRDMKDKLNSNWQDVRNSLQPAEAAIEFVKFNYIKRKTNSPDTVYYAAMLLRPRDTVPVFIKLFEENELKTALKSFAYKAQVPARGNLTDNKNNKKKNTTNNIYDLVWQPLEPYLDSVKTIYFSPDGLLHQLAFAAIPYKNSLLLCDKYKLVQVTSTRQVAIKEEHIKAPSSIALFGGIDYNKQNTDTSIAVFADPYSYVYQQNRSAGLDSFTYLPNTLKEVKVIQKNMELKQKKVSFYIGDKATEAAFRNLGGTSSPDVIHFATHGFTLPDTAKQKTTGTTFKISDNPLLRSGLVLAGGNKGWKGKSRSNEDDGILTALEITSVSLPNTQLAVLSACETGTGELHGSEGVFGLQRAFKIAGVNYVMASLWQVPDKETGEFMTYFYTRWLSGSSIRHAFIDAQQTMRKKYAPYYWAAFTLIQ